MTITRADVADLKPGDVVEITDERWPDGSVLRGPAYFDDDELRVGHLALVTCDGRLYLDRPKTTMRVVSRAPRPAYVNSDKTEPDPGDVVRVDRLEIVNAYLPDPRHPNKPWLSLRGSDAGCRFTTDQAAPDYVRDRLRLLVDGRTGQVVL